MDLTTHTHTSDSKYIDLPRGQGALIDVVQLDVGARHEGRTVEHVVLDQFVVPHDGTPAVEAGPGDCPGVADVDAAQLQHYGLDQPAEVGELCRSRPLTHDDPAEGEGTRWLPTIAGCEKKNGIVNAAAAYRFTLSTPGM